MSTSGFSQTMRARVNRELQQLSVDPPTGVAAWPLEDRLDAAVAQIVGPEDSPYHNGVFRLSVTFPLRYPFEPPAVQFRTKVYHPNIDSQGRICLDSLKMPPAGGWQPSLNLPQVLTQIRLLLATPNADDPLMPDVNQVYLHDRPGFEHTARRWTKEYAVAKELVENPVAPASSGREIRGTVVGAVIQEQPVDPRGVDVERTDPLLEKRTKDEKEEGGDKSSQSDGDSEDDDSSGNDSLDEDEESDDDDDEANDESASAKRQRTE